MNQSLPHILLGCPLLSAILVLLLMILKGKFFNGLGAVIATLSSLICLAAGLAFLKVPDGVGDPLRWMQIGDLKLEIGFTIDRLSRGMMFIVTLIGALVHIFSLAYMKGDEAKGRYFGALSMFMFSMTGIVLADNFAMMFIFWELVGVSSWMLIGHWFHKPSAADASKKAFLVNRIGDFGFMIGILILWGITGAVAFDEIEQFLNVNPLLSPVLLTVAVLCIFCGTVGKSAQAPLHVWLPDAMEGPTPVSALIHAATMVAAGVYMLARSSFLLEGVAELDVALTAPTAIAWVGGITSLLAALMAIQQDDIKRILAYSTLSQLGYMVMAVGLMKGSDQGAVGMFHLYTHAFFKALLFLGAGAAIYACHHEQNIWKMGGLLKKMPITGICFLVGTAALIAVPYTSGFWSKESVLATAHHESFPLFIITCVVAFCTAFYMTRLCVVAFFGKAREEGSDHAKEVGPLMFVPLVILALLALFSAYHPITEPLQAMVPKDAHPGLSLLGHGWFLPVLSFILTFTGILVGIGFYKGKSEDPISIPMFRNKFYVDEFYEKVVAVGQDGLAFVVNGIEKLLINGAFVGGSSLLMRGLGGAFRKLQTGNLGHYNLLFGAGVMLVIYLITFLL